METYNLEQVKDIRNLVSTAHEVGEPVVVYDGEDECLVAMSPAVFERILMDGAMLEATGRKTMRL